MPLYMLLLFTFALQGLFSWNPWYRKQKSIQIELNRTKLSCIVSFMIRISKLLLQLSWISWRWGWGSGSWGLGRGILSCSLESCLACPLSPSRPSIKTLCLLKFKVMVTPSPPARAGSGSDGYKVLLLHQPGRSQPLQHNLANCSQNLWPIWRNWPI